MSVTYRFPARSNAGPSRKLSITWPGLLASTQSVRRGVRNAWGRRVSTRASMISGGWKLRFHMAAWSPVGSVGLHARGLDHLAPGLGLTVNELAEVGRGQAARAGALLRKALREVRRCQRLLHLGLQLVDDRLRRALGRRDAEPVGGGEVLHAGLGAGGRLGQGGKALRRGHEQ